MRGSFTLELTQVLVEEIVGNRDHPVVPGAPLAALVAADQEDRGALRIEREEDADATCRGISSFMFLCLDCLIVSRADARGSALRAAGRSRRR
jgi:hypothetical protein